MKQSPLYQHSKVKISQIDPYLVASSIPFDAKDIHALHKQHVGAIVSLTSRSLIGMSGIDQPLMDQLNISYLHSPVVDHYPPSHSQMNEILGFIHSNQELKRTTLVHCHAGVGRTGTILYGYLLKRGLSMQAAQERIKQRRIQCLLISDAQRAFLAQCV